MDELIRSLAVYALPVLFAITLHEAAHGYAARFFGDNTAASQGRLSLNPAHHIDPFGTIALPLILFLTSAMVGTPFMFGYAKPVPVDFGKLRKPKRDMIWVAFAGPAANFVMAFMWLVAVVLLQHWHGDEFFIAMANAGVSVNLLFFALNMFPLPPLDGGRVLVGLLPHKQSYSLSRIEPYGIFIVMLLTMTRPFYSLWIHPVAGLAQMALNVLAIPLNYL